MSPNHAQSQSITFEKTYGGFANDEGHDIVQLPDGGFLVTGANGSLGDTSFNAYSLKIDSEGQVVYEKTFGGNFQDGGNEIAPTADGKFFVAGHTESYGLGDCEAWFFLLNANGDTLWTKSYGTIGDDAAYGSAVGDDGNFYAVGLVQNGANGGDGFFAKISPQGNFIHQIKYGGLGEDYLTQIRKTDDGNFMLAGKTFINGYANFWLIKVDTAGTIIWNKNFGKDADDEIAFGLRKSPDGGFLMTGRQQNFFDSSISLYFIRTDANGDTLWTKTISNSLQCAGSSIVWSIDNHWVICGDEYNPLTNSQDACLIKMTDAGQILWTKYFGGTAWENARRLIECTNGDFILVGVTKSFGAGAEDVFIVRTDLNGEVSSVSTPNSMSKIFVQPNPFFENSTISVFINGSSGKLLVEDIYGRILETIPVAESEKINFERKNLSDGIYFLKLINAGEIVETKKIIIE